MSLLISVRKKTKKYTDSIMYWCWRISNNTWKKNDSVKFRDYHMQTMDPFMIIADFETYTNKLNQVKPYSFAMFTHCIFNENKSKLTNYTGNDSLDKLFNDLTYHVNRINKIKSKPNLYSNPNLYQSNQINPICLNL